MPTLHRCPKFKIAEVVIIEIKLLGLASFSMDLFPQPVLYFTAVKPGTLYIVYFFPSWGRQHWGWCLSVISETDIATKSLEGYCLWQAP